jgi:hypothetical protein
MFHPPGGAIQLETERPQDGSKQLVDLHAVTAPAVGHDLVEQVLPVEREEPRGRVVQRDAVEGDPGLVMPHQAPKELQSVGRVLGPRVPDVLEVLLELFFAVRGCRHCGLLSLIPEIGADSKFL